MAALRPDQAKARAARAVTGAAETQVTPLGQAVRDRHQLFGRHVQDPAPVRAPTVRGSFRIRAGTIDVAEPLADSSVYVQIDPASFRTGNGQRDSNVRSEGLLDADLYPIITFRSEGMDGLTLTGALTVRNVTMPVSLSIVQSAVTPRSFNVHATTRIDRNQFGVTAYRGLAARYLDMTVEVRCVRT